MLPWAPSHEPRNHKILSFVPHAARFIMANSTLGNTSLRVHGGAQAGGISALATWADLQSLRDVRAAAYPGALADLGALASNAG